ncbi:MAG: transketolase, partial [Clostridia bacterium]
KVDPKNPAWPQRDRFVLSKGHVTPALYATLASRGYFPIALLKTFRSIDGNLSGHAEMRHVPGVDMSTGSLGQGVSAALGMALSGKMFHEDYRVYALLGDGEIQEGQVWEAAMSAGAKRLDNFVAIVDNNRLQLDGSIEQILDPEPIDQKFEAFKWHVISIDGHDVEQLAQAFEEAKHVKGKPTAIIAHTVKGKGVSFMENDVKWHGATPSDTQFKAAFLELNRAIAELEG